jgi:hypothetical protein
LENYKNFSQAIDSVTDNGGSSYTINTTALLYLEDGDTVKINGVEYTVSNIVADTSFDVSGADPTGGTSYISNPYEYVEYCIQEFII